MNEDAIQLGRRWCEVLLETLRPLEAREPLRDAAARESLADWTRLMTDALVRASQAMGWVVAAKGHKLELLPQAGQEYLTLDGMAFDPATAPAGARWHWPVAVYELENAHADDRTAYSLWKVLNVQAPLRVVVAYRRLQEQAGALPGILAETVIRSTMSIERWNAIAGEVLLVIGSRCEAESFPWGYFRFWRYDREAGRFVRAAS